MLRAPGGSGLSPGVQEVREGKESVNPTKGHEPYLSFPREVSSSHGQLVVKE